jgi:hypothetical protein
LTTIHGRVTDAHGNAIQGASVVLLGRTDVSPSITDAKGEYLFATNAMPMEKIRIKASKRNYSDGLGEIVVLTKGTARKSYVADDIQLTTPITIVTIDYAKKTVTGARNLYSEDGTVTIQTPNSTYQIPAGSIVDQHGEVYTKGPIDVYLYEFDKGNPPESLMQLDTFDQVIGYAGNLMKTFGMPYIQFFAQDGEELGVLKSRPMVLTYRIANMQELRDNTDHIYQPLTDADMEFLVESSRGQPYRIDRDFLIKTNMLRFPAFWVFDRKRGIWDNVGVSVLNKQGVIQTIFYTIRDDIQ